MQYLERIRKQRDLKDKAGGAVTRELWGRQREFTAQSLDFHVPQNLQKISASSWIVNVNHSSAVCSCRIQILDSQIAGDS